MKRFLILLLCALLLVPAAASAAIPPQPLPDPALAMEKAQGTLYKWNIELFEGDFYDIYRYPLPKDFHAFLDAYTVLAKQNRFAVTEKTIEGITLYHVFNFDEAYLIPADDALLFAVNRSNFKEFIVSHKNCFCRGTGLCIECDGKGICARCHGTGIDEYQGKKTMCYSCWGTARCDRCGGSGKCSI